MDSLQKVIYGDICNGFTPIKCSFGKFYLKHPSHSDFFSLYESYDQYLDLAAKNGIKKQQDCIKFIIDQNWWDEEKEERIRVITNYIKTQEKTLKAMNWEKDKVSIRAEKEKWEAILESYLFDRRKLTGMTAEEWISEKIAARAISEFFYQDSKLSEKLDEDIIEENFDLLNREYNNFLVKFDLENIKLIAAGPFFRGLLFMMGEDISGFFGTCAAKLTKFQSDLLTYSKIYQNKIKNHYSNPNNKQEIPSEILENADLLIKWAETDHNILNPKVRKDGAKTVQGYFGSPEEAKTHGVKFSNKDFTVN